MVLSQSEELRLVSLNQELLPNSLHQELRLKLNLLSNITLNLRLLIQVIMSDSMSKVLLLKIFLEVQLLLILNKTQPKLVKLSMLRLSSWNIQDKSKTDTHLSLIVIPLILPVNLRKFSNLLTRELVRLCRKSQLLSKLVTLPLSNSSQLNRWLLRLSKNIQLSEDLPSEIWNRLSVLVSSKKLLRKLFNNKYYFNYLFKYFLYKWKTDQL